MTIATYPPQNVSAQTPVLGYAEITSDTSTITTAADISGLSVTVTVPAGRRIRVTVKGEMRGTANDVYVVTIKEGASVHQRETQRLPSASSVTVHAEVVLTPTAGIHTYNANASLASGTGVIFGAAPTYPAFILVEDITGSQLPVLPQSVPVGVLAQAQSIASVTVTTIQTLLSVNFVVPAGRTIKITAGANVNIGTAGGRALGAITLDGVDVGRWCDKTVPTIGYYTSSSDSVLVSPSAGAHTVIMSMVGIGGASISIEAASSEPIHLIVEDVTPTPAPGQGAPGSTLGYFDKTSGSQGPITSSTPIDLADMSVTATIPAGRRIRVSAQCIASVNNSGDETGNLIILEGATALTQARELSRVAGVNVTFTASVVLSPSAGSHTYKLAFERESGTGGWTVNYATSAPAFILVEDITGAVWPVGSTVTAGMIASEAWTDYTPTDTSVTVGNGTRVARYTRIGRTIHFSWQLTFGSTSAFTGTVSVGIPVPSANVNNLRFTNAGCYLLDAGTQDYSQGGIIPPGSSICQPRSNNGGGINATTPFTWTTGDVLTVAGTYEAAS